MKVIIMAGGSGTRFWPKSRKNIPKQCIPISSNKPMIVETIERMGKLVSKEDILISTGSHLADSIKSLMPNAKFVIEPMARNTAACIGLSAISVEQEEIIIIETADHTYENPKLYLEDLKEASEFAEQGKIVLIGIKPTFPHTGFGYIEAGKKIEAGKINVFEVKSFKEKPDLEMANSFIKKGNFFWNAGIFVFKAKTMLDNIKEYMPILYSALLKIKKSGFDKKILYDEFEKLEKISIDYGVMEKSKDIVVVKGDFHWDDIGDWKAMERIHEKDEFGNVILGKHNGNPSNCIIFGDEKEIQTKNIENLIIIDTKDALLVCSKDNYQDIKEIVGILKKDKTLKGYAEFIQENNVFHKIELSCINTKVKGNCLIACIGLKDIVIEKNDKIVVSKVDKE